MVSGAVKRSGPLQSSESSQSFANLDYTDRQSMGWAKNCAAFLKETMFIYETPKVVLIQSAKIGFVFRAIQLGILVYFIIWVMWYEKGYQKQDEAISGVTTKVKGVAWSNMRDPDVGLAHGPRIWDDGDYSIPPQQNAGFFVVTRVATLLEQTPRTCPETHSLRDARCRTDADCVRGESAGSRLGNAWEPDPTEAEIDIDLTGHGVFTGACSNSTGTCEVFAWCPIYDEASATIERYKRKNGTYASLLPDKGVQEVDEKYEFMRNIEFLRNRQAHRPDENEEEDASPPFYDAENFTVYVKNSIEFPSYGVKRRNILPDMTEEYLENCRYNKDHPKDKYCPVMQLGYIIRETKADLRRLLKYGGVIAITIEWVCDLDLSIDECLPRYEFRQLDDPPEDQHNQRDSKAPLRLGEGWKVEYAYHYGNSNDNEGGRRRILAVVNGIQFLVQSTGKAGRFNIIQFTMNCGSFMALFGTATLVCDLILLNVVRDRHRYRRAVCDGKPIKAGGHNNSNGNNNPSSTDVRLNRDSRSNNNDELSLRRNGDIEIHPIEDSKFVKLNTTEVNQPVGGGASPLINFDYTRGRPHEAPLRATEPQNIP